MGLTWWLRAVGGLYLLIAILSIGPRIPIKAEGPPGVLSRAAAGDPLARFVLDTWTMFGLYIGAFGISLLVASPYPTSASALAWAAIALELIGGIGIDVYKLTRGYKFAAPLVWIAIHTAVIVTGLIVLGKL
jgi:hypothetical protein